ncbi:unnamed protein product, partial [Toxocara canis]|uniref:Pepsin-I3 domain-containing protein n=1 Tax=Toxocara canis TaxID=6265 RepID=A0A183UKI0_TOXCA
ERSKKIELGDESIDATQNYKRNDLFSANYVKVILFSTMHTFSLSFVICIVHHISSFEYGISNFGEPECIVDKNVLYIDGIKMSTLTPSQQQELASYQQEMDAYEKKMDECEQLMSKSADHKDISCPDSPQRPSFCNVTVMNIEGCKFMDGKLYIHENLVRELTNEEKTKIAQFNEQYKKYMDYQNELLDQAEYDMDGNMIMNGTTMSDQQPAVPMPKNPKICTSF